MPTAEAIGQLSPCESFVAVGSARLFVREVGAGTPIVVLHGGPDFNHAYLLPELDDLASAARLIYYDQRGRGRSSPGVEPTDVSLETEMADLDALRQHLDLASATLLGHSFGALLAMEYAARLPSRVERLILLNAAPASHAGLLRLRQYRQSREAPSLQLMQALAASPNYAEGDLDADAKYHAAHFSAAFHDARHVPTVVARLRSHFAPSDVIKARAIEHRLYAQTWFQPDYDLMPRLARLDAPALVIHGNEDLVPVECAQDIAHGIKNARLEVLEDCGHFAYVEQTGRVRALIASFVKQR